MTDDCADEGMRRLYSMTPYGEAQALAAFRLLGYSEQQVRDPAGMPNWLAELNSNNLELEDEPMVNREGWIVFAPFKAGDRQYHRGDFLSRAQGLALRDEIRNSYLKPALLPEGFEPDWRPRAAPAPVAVTFQPEPVEVELIGDEPTPHCRALAVAMQTLMASGRDWSVAKDLVDHGVLMRAQKEFVDAPKYVVNGGRKVRSGRGTQRRVAEGFWPFIACLVDMLRKRKAA